MVKYAFGGSRAGYMAVVCYGVLVSYSLTRGETNEDRGQTKTTTAVDKYYFLV